MVNRFNPADALKSASELLQTVEGHPALDPTWHLRAMRWQAQYQQYQQFLSNSDGGNGLSSINSAEFFIECLDKYLKTKKLGVQQHTDHCKRVLIDALLTLLTVHGNTHA